MSIVWGIAPPPGMPNSHIRVLVVKTNERYSCLKLGPLESLQGHFHQGRFRPCSGARTCRLHGLTLEWKGFLAVAVHGLLRGQTRQQWNRWVLCVSAGIGQAVKDWPTGEIAIVGRPGAFPNSPMSFELTGKRPGPPIPEWFDARPFIVRALKIQESFKLRRPEEEVG